MLYFEMMVSHAGCKLRPLDAWWEMASLERVVIVSFVVIVPSKSRMKGRGGGGLDGGVAMLREDLERIVVELTNFRTLISTRFRLNIDGQA